MIPRLRAGLVLASGLVIAACKPINTLQRSLVEPAAVATVDQRLPLLKAHLHDGHVVVLSRWEVDTTGRAVVGDGERLDVNRLSVAVGTHRLPLDSVALFETNVVRPH